MDKNNESDDDDEIFPREVFSISIMPFIQSASTGTNYNGSDKLAYYDYTMQQSLLTPTSNSAQVNGFYYPGETQTSNAVPLANTVAMPLSAIPEPINFMPLFFPWDPQDSVESSVYDSGPIQTPNIPTGNTYGNLASEIIARALGYNHLAEIDSTDGTTVEYVPLYFDYSNYTNDFFSVLENPISRDPSKLFGYGYFNIDYKKYGIRSVIEMRPLKNIGFKFYTGVSNLEMNINDSINTTALTQGPIVAHMYTRYPDAFSNNSVSSANQYYVLNIAQLSPYSRALVDNDNNTGPTSNPDLTNPNVLFADQFKSLLIRIYGGALAQVKDQKIQYKPMRAAPDDTDVIVRTVVIGRGEPIQLDYRVEKTANGWKVYDINVLGAWLLESYRNQFNDQVSKGGVEGLIQFLQQRNSALAAAK